MTRFITRPRPTWMLFSAMLRYEMLRNAVRFGVNVTKNTSSIRLERLLVIAIVCLVQNFCTRLVYQGYYQYLFYIHKYIYFFQFIIMLN